MCDAVGEHDLRLVGSATTVPSSCAGIEVCMTGTDQDALGRVYLVGAGPGDPDLITVKGMRCLQAADVVVYDRLANAVLLDLAPSAALRVFAGKAPGSHALSQEQINAALVEHGRAGKRVVRLKAGDPYVFGRGGEE